MFNYERWNTIYKYSKEENFMNLYKKLLNINAKLSVIGLCYVGMPIGISFAKKVNVIGFDINESKIDTYLNGQNSTKEVGDKAIKDTTLKSTSNSENLEGAIFHISRLQPQ